MAKKRIPEKPSKNRDLVYHIAAGITANPGWPTQAPATRFANS